MEIVPVETKLRRTSYGISHACPRTFSLSRARQALKSRVLEIFAEQLAAAQSLTDEQVRVAVEWLADEKISASVKADFLTALAQKGETPDEIAAFARTLREKSIPLPLDAETRAREILDIVGTGGDHLGTFNISTTAAIICAAAGVTVAKHGNRAVTSQAGSADVLEALGIRIDLTPTAAARSLREQNFVFLFAPNFHPVFKNISPARKLCAERGRRTIFNLLGPLLNPARPSAMLVGMPRAELCEPLAQVLQTLGVRRAMVVCGKIGNRKPETGNFLDELSTLGENTIAEFYQARGFTVSTTLPEQFPLQPAALEDLLGGDKFQNAEIVRRILHGQERGPKRDAVLLNAGAALFIAGKSKSLIEGWELAGEMIDSGAAERKLRELSA
jgi:anthranilate phosphoribosyltransferase